LDQLRAEFAHYKAEQEQAQASLQASKAYRLAVRLRALRNVFRT
jgi:hypothetical protein